MISAVKIRLAALGTAAAVMGILIVFVILDSQRQGADLRAKLDEVETQSQNMAEHFKDLLRESSDKLARYRSTGDAAAWNDFLNSKNELNRWIQNHTAGQAAPREQDILQQMKAKYGDYLQVVGEVRQKILASGPDGSYTLDQLKQTQRRLFDLGEELSQAHLDPRNQYLAEAHQMLRRLRLTILGALALLFLSVIGLAVFVFRDMIMPLQMKLVETQAMVGQREKLASLGLLAAGVAHEIRNPLTAIKAALFTQQKKFNPGSPEHNDVKVVEREIVRLERIVNDFLQFARPAEPEAVVIAADLLLLEIKLFFTPQLEKNGIQMTLEPSAPMYIKVDPAQMKQVLINLVQNAADSIGQNGAITLRARQARKPLLNGEKSTVILEVADTGRGIPPEAQKRLFDPFFTTKENGTGLGLSIAARIVQKHGGVLQYQTQVNRGTTFGILLPQANT
ncbi:MAG TPA: ATP-binding protein [Candidatus Acidoferrales bacterium]|nr:ATP-binding protein [Candidatus Acidoferrales bacterium]